MNHKKWYKYALASRQVSALALYLMKHKIVACEGDDYSVKILYIACIYQFSDLSNHALCVIALTE